MLEHIKKTIIVVLLLVLLVGCKEQILHNLTEREANRFLISLYEIGIKSEKIRQADGGWAIAVESSETQAAIKYLDDSRMFRTSSLSTKGKGSMLAGREEQRYKFERALSYEIESTLTGISGVLEARVHLNLPRVDPLFGRALEKNQAGSASVLLVIRAGNGIPREQISGLVSGASGIPKKDVVVLMTEIGLHEQVKGSGGALMRRDSGSAVQVDQHMLELSRLKKTSVSYLPLLLIAVGGGALAYLYFPIFRKPK